MENNPKKSKAFIIAFILILLLLVIGYYLFTNRNKIFDAKGVTSVSKIFAPLLGTSKDKGLTVIDTGKGTNTGTDGENITGIIITDQAGNKIVRAEAGENLKKGDVLYISGFNKNKDPIVMKAIASDKAKSLVFGVAGEDMNKGEMGNIIIEGVLTGVPTNRNEGTLWLSKNPLYLSDKVYGGMTKNPPFAPNFVVTIGSVLVVHPINGSIRIGRVLNTNPDLLNSSNNNVRGYLNSIFNNNGFNNNGNNGFNLNPINLPGNQNNIFPSVVVIATPTSIKSGEESTITWDSINATACTLSGGGITGTGIKNTVGVKTGKLTKGMSYTVKCTGVSGSSSGSVYVIITNEGVENTPTFPIIKVTATPNSIKSGEESTITWESTNANSCNLYDGTKIIGTGIKNTVGVKTGKLTKSMAYTVTCIGKNKETMSETAYVMIDNSSGQEQNFPIIKVTATPNSIKSGEESTITWESTNANSCSLSGGGITGTGINNSVGVKTGKLTKNMAYTVKCVGSNGTVAENAYVNVEPDYKFPTINLSVETSPKDNSSSTSGELLKSIVIKYGGKATINWKSANTTKCEIDLVVGNSSSSVSTKTTKTVFKSNDSYTTPALTLSKSYSVICTGDNGTIGDAVYINVSPEEITSTNDGNNNGTGGGTPPPGDGNTNKDPAKCKVIDANPLTYTEAEQRQLDDLLRKFYIIASSLKTDADIQLAYREVEEYKALVSQVKYITKQCYDQIKDPNYTGPRTQYGNPWFKYGERGSYLPAEITIESKCKYCEPNADNGYSCKNLAQTKDQSIPFCEPNGKEMRASGNYSRYYNAFGIPAFGEVDSIKNKGNPITNNWTKAAITYMNPVYGIASFIWKTKYYSPGPSIRYADLKDFEKILNIW